MASDRMIVEDLLTRRGYKKVEPNTPLLMLKDKEYLLFPGTGGKQVLQMGSGRSGEAGCSVTLYFNEHGDFTEHSADNDLDGEASDLDTDINGQPRP